ncbi:MAG: hypothetical protein R3B72_44610 [Polyangiaceae bacterium]
MQVADAQLQFVADPVSPRITHQVSVEVVVHTDPPQRQLVGTFHQESCQVWHPTPEPPVISQLDCVHDGPIGLVELIRAKGGAVRIDVTEGPDGPDPEGTRHWTAGLVTIPEGRSITSSTVDRDAELRAATVGPPLRLRLRKHARGTTLELDTEPPQTVVATGWDATSCTPRVDPDATAHVAFFECPPDRDSLLLAYVGHDAVAVQAVKSTNPHSALGFRKLGNLRIPRDRIVAVATAP